MIGVRIPEPRPLERCLDDDALAALFAGDAAGPEAEAMRHHLDVCIECHALAAVVAKSEVESAEVASGERAAEGSTQAELSRLLAAHESLPPGTRLGRYVVGRELGRGGMGRVYFGHDPELSRDVALKVVAHTAGDSDAQRRRLVREARAAAQLVHPNVVTILDVGQREDVTYVAMELVVGKSLRAYVGDLRTPVRERVGWLLEVARALAAAHARGLVHRDIKPENVMVREDGAIKVVDFGIARRVEGAPALGAEPTTVTRTDAIVGTPMYMAPEQLRGEDVDGRCDQFAWGVLAYELATGKRPWSGTGLSLASQILSAELPRFGGSGLSRSPGSSSALGRLEAIVGRATAKAPEQRFASMADVVLALERLHSASSSATPRRVVVAAALATGAVCALGTLAFRSPRASPPTLSSGAVAAPPSAPPADPAPPPTPLVASSAPAIPLPSASARPSARKAAPPASGPKGTAAPPAGSASAAPPSCDPPFVWREGIRVPKRECPLD